MSITEGIGLSIGNLIVTTTKNSEGNGENKDNDSFRNNIYTVVLDYMKKAVQSDRSTLIYTLEKEGHKCGSDIIRRL